MRCGSMDKAGNHWPHRIRSWRSCGCCAATRSHSSSSALRWSTSSRPPCANTILRLWRRLMTGPSLMPGASWRPFPLRKTSKAPESASGRSSSTPASSGGRTRARSGWKSLPAPPGSAAPRGDRRQPRAFCRHPKPPVPCRHRAGHDPIRADPQTPPAPRLRSGPAQHGPSMGRPQPQEMRVGASLLPSPPCQRPEPCLRAALPRAALAQNPLENVADPHPLRRGSPHQKSNPTRLLDPPTQALLNLQKTHANNSAKKTICSTENI